MADSPGNGGGGSDATAGRAIASGGGDVKATVRSSESKPGVCAARGGAGEVHNTFPDDGSCVHSQFEGGLPSTELTAVNLTINAPSGSISFDIWEDPDGTVNFTVTSGGPFTGAFYVKGGPTHVQCVFTNVTSGSCSTALGPNGSPAGFSHLDVCVGENPPPPPPPDIPENPPTQDTPGQDTPEDDVLTEEQQEQREEQREEQQEELEEATPPVVPSAVTPAPEEGLPFTGLDTGWLVLMSLALLGSGVALRRKVS